MAGAEAGLPPGEHGAAGQQPGIATLVFNDSSKYTGTLRNGTPHGLGTCVWKDGNQYDGEWKNGLMHGFGTYLWTSGQRYDGEWKDGKRDGVGVKMYADGSKFHGIWRDGKKHGVGVFRPAPRDRSKSLAKTSSGRNIPSPSDVDPSVYNLRATEGTPPQQQPRETHQQDAEPAQGAGESSSPAMPTAPHSPPASEVGPDKDRGREKEGHRDKDKDKERDKEKDKEKEKEKEREGKLLLIRVFEDGVLKREEKLSSEDAKMIFGQAQTTDARRGSRAKKKVKRALGFGKKLQQKHGQLLYKGMPGYNLMLRLQHGIRWSIGRGSYSVLPGQQHPTQQLHPCQATNSVASLVGVPLPLSHKLVEADFTEKVKVFFPSAGSSITPAHPAGDFKWKDYSPRVFRNLRNMYGIADADYMLSLGGSSALWQLNSPGKSGCMFFLSDDERFLVKTMRKTEIRTLIDMLPKYYSYMESQPGNLVIRFFGVHGVKQLHGRTVRFVVMHNMFNTDLQIHKKFDLKGSTDGRTTGPKVKPDDPKTIFKDLDLDMQFLLHPAAYSAVIRQIHSDAEFLRAVDVMDYSLLLGIHFCNRARLPQEGDTSTAAGQSQGQHHVLVGQQPPPLQPQPSTKVPTRQQASVSGQGLVLGNGGSPAGAPSASGVPVGLQGLHQLQPMDSHGSEPGEDASGHNRMSPVRNGPPASPGGFAPGRISSMAGGGGGGEDPDGEHVRNFDLFSDRLALDKQLVVFEERMRGMGYSEQRIRDILSLARLRILGDQLKDRSKKAYKVYDGPSTVLQALASRRQGAENLPRLEEAEDPTSDDDDEGGPGMGKQPPCLGHKLRALAVHKKGGQPPEEVVLCFGIIDILQDWNMRKVVERTFKSFTHDSFAISVAPPKLYSMRFDDFLTKTVFMDPADAAAKGLYAPSPHGNSIYGMPHQGVPTIEEERA
ncbi:hypothetical protein Agub_g6852 [Astrephomene gubernaculifera]|uniref:1-phosphatidylinositol-4-phosphate 5-kinase n=1 Tax=Astrephomene gubernaculifera TaxID=47775 RepID=A0AAD3HM69_9CHLO|nr:hypothetical protein Agub_g6852 [Astrephomene gubernaculifera]